MSPNCNWTNYEYIFWITFLRYESSGGILTGENGTSGAPGTTRAINNVISQQGIKNLVHDVQIKRQREIRDMMKKKREKAVLVDRISRWLFPTSFILLNIVYWALFGDHELWWFISVIFEYRSHQRIIYNRNNIAYDNYLTMQTIKLIWPCDDRFRDFTNLFLSMVYNWRCIRML